MTIARRRATTFTALTAPAAPVIEAPRPLGPIVLPPMPRDVPAPETVIPAGRLRRCTFRRIDLLEALPGRSERSSYEIMCLYGGEAAALALGDIESARPVCEGCLATGIFRPDEA